VSVIDASRTIHSYGSAMRAADLATKGSEE